jgi:hypothetical protein
MEVTDKLRDPEVMTEIETILRTENNLRIMCSRLLKIALQRADITFMKELCFKVFCRAIADPSASRSFAKVCRRMAYRCPDCLDYKSTPPKNLSFKTLLLSHLQNAFEAHYTQFLEGVTPKGQYTSYLNFSSTQKLGTVKLIGEMYLLGLLNDKIIVSCISALLKGGKSSEEPLFALSNLVSLVGGKFEDNQPDLSNTYFEEITEYSNNESLPADLRTSLQTLISLRNAQWENWVHVVRNKI